MSTFIYVLKEPDTGDIRYVGKTNRPHKRLSEHVCEKSNTHRVKWIASLKTRGMLPTIEILDEVPEELWEFIEQSYIRVFRAVGLDLVNETDGGDGVHNPSAESRKRLSDASKIRGVSRACRDAQRASKLGKRMTEDQKEKISRALSGRVLSEEHKAALRKPRIKKI